MGTRWRKSTGKQQGKEIRKGPLHQKEMKLPSMRRQKRSKRRIKNSAKRRNGKRRKWPIARTKTTTTVRMRLPKRRRKKRKRKTTMTTEVTTTLTTMEGREAD